MAIKNAILILLVLLSAILFSCKHELEKPGWNVNLLTPLIKSSLSIENIVADSLLKVNTDSTISIVYRTNLYQISLDSLVTISDTNIIRVFNLDSLKLSTQTIVYPLTLADLAREAGNPLETIILSNHGNVIPIPPFSNLSADSIDIDANLFFQTATIPSGSMDVQIQNGFPIDVNNLIYQLRNKSNDSVVLQDTFMNIPAGMSDQHTLDLSGKTVEGNLVAQIINLNSPGGFVLIDTNNALTITLTIRDIKVFSATAVFPAQDIVADSNDMVLDMGGARITEAILQSGFVRIEVISTAGDTTYFTYSIPGATLNGQPFLTTTKVPPAPVGDTVHVVFLYDFSGYKLDLTGENGDTYNTLYNVLTGRIDSTGNIVTMTLSDSFYIDIGLLNIVPEYIKGTLNEQAVSVGPGVSSITLFNRIESGTLDLENVKVTLAVDNGLGVGGRMDINNIKSVNNKTGTSQNLTVSTLAGSFNIARALDMPLTPVTSVLEMNTFNSNIKSLIEIFPDELQYAFTLYINPMSIGMNSGANNYYKSGVYDFAYSYSNLSANFDLEIPLSFISNTLTLNDTTDFSLDNVQAPEKIKDGILTLLVDNGFPLESNIELYFLDAMYQVIDSLISYTKIDAASINGSGRVTNKKRTRLIYPITEDKMQNIFRTKKMIINAAFTTLPASQYLKIYSDYTIDFKLVADFYYRMEVDN